MSGETFILLPASRAAMAAAAWLCGIDDLAVSQFQPRVGRNGTQLAERRHQYWR